MGNLAPRSRRVFALEHLKSQYRQVIDESLSENNLVYQVLRDIITDYCGYEAILEDFLNKDMPITPEMVDLLPTLLQWDLDPCVMTLDAKVDSPAILRSDVKPQISDVRAYRRISLGPGKLAGKDVEFGGTGRWTSNWALFTVLPWVIRQNSIFLVNAMWPSSDAFSFSGEWCPILRLYLFGGPDEKQLDQFLQFRDEDTDWKTFCDSAPKRMATWEHAFRLASNDFSDLKTLHVLRYISTAINAFWTVPSKPWKRAFDIFSFLSFDQKRRMFPSGRLTLDDIVEVDIRDRPWVIAKLAGINKSITKSRQKLKRKALVQEVDELMKESVDETMDEASDTETLLSFRNRLKSHVKEHRVGKKPKAFSSKSK
jgi:hypothetical protein